MSARVRLGLVGFGYWGPNLARNFRALPGIDLAAIADARPDRRAQAESAYPGTRLYEDANDLITAADTDAVAIATPVSTHYDLAVAALKGGKDVFVEKPLAASTAQAASLVELAERESRVLMVDHVYVYSGAVRKIAELIGGGELGDVCYYDSIRINLGLFQTDVSVVWDLAVHDVSLLRFLLGRKFESVQATGGCHLGGSLDNVAHITVGLEGGAQAHINVSWIAPVKIRQTIIVGDRKMLLYDDLEPDEKIKVYDRGVVFDPDRRAALLPDYRVGDMWAPRVDRREALGYACAHFLECIRTRSRPLTNGFDAVDVVRLLEATERSLAERGRRVTL
jgi:predicted dehydrogenase